MVYLAIGFLVVALSVTVYSFKFSKHTESSLPWRGNQGLEKAATESQDVGNQDNDSQMQGGIPSFTLDNGEDETILKASAPEQLPVQAPTLNRKSIDELQTQDTAMMPPPAPTVPNAKRKAGKHTVPFMPPPSRPRSTSAIIKTSPKPSTALRSPPSAASRLRGPPSSSLKSSPSLAPSISTLAPSARPSKKVLLDPGHSPLDWAHLTANPPTPTFLRGADVPLNLIRVPPSALRYHTGRKGKDAWGVYQGKVYNMTPYMKFHPGGVDQLMRGAGKEKEGERLFNEIHPWVSWENMLGECLVGILVSENEAQTAGGNGDSTLDEMD